MSDQIKKISIGELVFDDKNVNRGTDSGKKIIHNSIARYGVGRGVLVDKNLKLIAGNHAVAEMIEQGIEEVIVVQTNGKQLVVTQRTDIEKDSAAGHGLAIADNRSTQANLDFDFDGIAELDAEFDLGLEDFEMNLNEITDAADQMEEYPDEEESHENGVYEDSDRVKNNVMPVMAAISKAQRIEFDKIKKLFDCTTDTETVLRMMKEIKELYNF